MRIPLPGSNGEGFLKGLNTGSAMFSRIMNPIIEREKAKQLGEQFSQTKKQQAEQFAQELALRKQAEARMGANLGLNRQILQQQLLQLQHQNDPRFARQQFQDELSYLMGLTGQGAQQNNVVQNQEPNQYANLIDMMNGSQNQEMPQGQGALMMPEESQAQNLPQQNAPAQNGLNMDAMKNSPLIRGYLKKHFGYDPFAQTPEDKEAAALDLFKKKEDIKNASKGGEVATNKVLTQNQQAVQAIDTVIPMIDELINNPDLVYGPSDFSPSKKAAYNAKTGGMIDMLVAAQSLPQVKESVNLVEEQIRRGFGESKESYKKRLQDFRKDLIARKKKSVGVVNSKKVDTSIITPEETKTLNGVKYEKINGEWHVAE